MYRIMRLKILTILICLSAVLQAADLKIAIVDTDRILRESAPAVRAGKKLESEFGPRKSALVKLTQQMRHLQKRLENDKIDEPTRRNYERELLRLTQDFQRMQADLNEDMNTRRNEEISILNGTVVKAIEQIAKDAHIDLVLQEAVYYDKSIDITDKALQFLSDK